jgi:hypothetical protein
MPYDKKNISNDSIIYLACVIKQNIYKIDFNLSIEMLDPHITITLV